MLKALAEYAMRGRLQAICIALIGSWLPFISQAVLGLVTLRKGWQEGLIVTLWASLPAFVGLWMAKVSAPIALASIVVFFIGYIGCCVLRNSISWPYALAAIVLASSASALLIVSASEGVVEHVSAFFEQALQGPDGESSQQALDALNDWGVESVAGLIGNWVAVTAIVGVLIARWWQALLYNPGGFRTEFHGMRLNSQVSVTCAFAAIVFLGLGSDYQFWSALAGLPLLFAGLGLAHWLIARYRLGTPAVVILYIALPLITFSAMILMALALIDSLLDIRNRLKTDQPPQT